MIDKGVDEISPRTKAKRLTIESLKKPLLGSSMIKRKNNGAELSSQTQTLPKPKPKKSNYDISDMYDDLFMKRQQKSTAI